MQPAGIAVDEHLICLDDSNQLNVVAAFEARKKSPGMVMDEADDGDADGSGGLGRKAGSKAGEE